MYLLIEGHRLLNLDLVSMVEMNNRTKTATVWERGVNVASDSRIVYRHFSNEESVQVLELPAEEV